MSQPIEAFNSLLSQLGFSTNEIVILKELYSSNEPKKADELSGKCGVPLTRTYEALDELDKKGFIVVQSSRPRKYIVKLPTLAIEQFLVKVKEDYQQQIQGTTNTAKEFLKFAEDIYLQYNTQIEPDDLLVDYRSLDDAEEQTLQLIKDAKEEILIFTHVFQWFFEIKEELIDAINRGCKIKVMMHTGPIEESSTARKIQKLDTEELEKIGIEVRKIPTEGIKTRGTLVDKKAVIFVIWVDSIGNLEKPHRRIYRPQFSSNPGIVEVFYGYFNHLWERN